VVLYRLCTGRFPFQGRDAVSTLMAVVTEQPPAPAKIDSEVPIGLSDLVMKLLAKDPAHRIATAQEIGDTLLKLEKSDQATQAMAKPSAPTRRDVNVSDRRSQTETALPSPAAKGRTLVLLGLGGGLAAVIGAAILIFWPKPEATETKDPKTMGFTATYALSF